ncbi:MAG: hypothetical protein Q9209_006519 [Squamulea sp. 1 TL-2023]
MAPEVRETPFVKELASSDRKIREKALESLRTYLLCNRNLTEIDLLKLWRGLFFCLYHTPHPATQHALSKSLASLFLPLPTILFTPFLTAFWTTIISEYTSIPQLRLDKYLLLIRCYISSTFQYLSNHQWDEGLLEQWKTLMEGGELIRDKEKEEKGVERLTPLSPRNGKVPDGVRYHVLDVWVDELVDVVGSEKLEERVMGMVMAPIQRLEREGRTKVVKGRARDVLQDDRLGRLVSGENRGEKANGKEEEEWEGFED